MLTIKNINKIVNKTLGKKNFYVERITEMSDVQPNSSIRTNHRYKIELTNRKYGMNVFLERELQPEHKAYRLLGPKNNCEYLGITQIKNMDIFLDKIRYIGID